MTIRFAEDCSRKLRFAITPALLVIATLASSSHQAAAQYKTWYPHHRKYTTTTSTSTSTTTTTAPTTTTTSTPTSTSTATTTTTTPSTTTTTTATVASFSLTGLASPATVTESIFVNGSGLTSVSAVYFYIDSQLVGTATSAPYWLGSASGYSVNSLTPGAHTLTATAVLTSGSQLTSSAVTLNVVPSINSQFSAALASYANHPTAQQLSPTTILANTSTSGASLTAAEVAVRQSVVNMYANWGIDTSLDYTNDDSTVLASSVPKTWQAPASSTPSAPFSMAFSPDAPFYHAIPANWPRVALPAGYVTQFQLNTNQGGTNGNGDGIGYGETVATSSSPNLTATSEWYSNTSTLVTFPFRMQTTWDTAIPSQPSGDKHVIFIDPFTSTYASSYMTSKNASTGGPDGLYISKPVSFNSLGTAGGSAAAHFAELPAMIQPGEATNPTNPIPHAIMGPVARPWAARVFPASARDAGILTSTNSCTGSGYTNNGLVPYGGIIQLDPALNLASLTLSLPARRILQAMQTYGYYVVDLGCGADIDIYTAVPETELDPFGGSYGNSNGPGVQNEIQSVLTSHSLYVVPPMTKKQ